MPDLLPPRLRRHFRELAVGWTLREIGDMWQDEGFVPDDAEVEIQGQRRGLWVQYENAVDWSYEPHVARVLRVYENLVPTEPGQMRDETLSILRREDLDVDARGRIVRNLPVPTSTQSSTVLVGGRYLLDPQPLDDSGGFGTVYFATDTMARFGDPERLALKRLKPDVLTDAEQVARFRREIRIGTEIRHPNVLRVVDSGNDEEGDWYVTEIADGGSLRRFVPDGGLDGDGVLEILRQVCAGVQHLHARDTLHRDLSPGNVLLFGETWVLADFGLSVSGEVPMTYRTSTGAGNIGTPAFIAPEQLISLHAATTRSDIYGLGKLLQFVSEGIWPTGTPVLRNPLRDVINMAAAHDPAARHGTVADFMAAVEVTLAQPPTTPESNADVADRYVDGLARGSMTPEQAREVVLWLSNLDPSAFRNDLHLMRVFAAFQQRDLSVMCATDPEAFQSAFRTYCHVLLGAQLSYEQLDRPAAVVFSADRAADEVQIRYLAINTLAELGARNNRFYIRRLIIEMLKNTPAGALVSPTISGLRASGRANWVMAENDPDEFGPHLRGWLRELR